MTIRYANGEVKKICNNGAYALRYFTRAEVKILMTLMTKLDALDCMDRFRTVPALKKYNCHRRHTKENITQYQLYIGYSVRMIVQLEIGKDEKGNEIVTIMEVSQHYGD